MSEESNDKAKQPMPEKFQSIVKEIDKLSALELSELVKSLEDHYGVSAAAPVAMAAVGGAGAGAGAAEEEKSSYTVELAAAGDNKINVIKVVKEITGKGLKEAKDLVDGAPKPVKENVPKAEAEEIKKKIEDAGGSVNLK